MCSFRFCLHECKFIDLRSVSVGGYHKTSNRALSFFKEIIRGTKVKIFKMLGLKIRAHGALLKVLRYISDVQDFLIIFFFTTVFTLIRTFKLVIKHQVWPISWYSLSLTNSHQINIFNMKF
jgi:hypothetical protein